MRKKIWCAGLLAPACCLLAWQANEIRELEALLPKAPDRGAVMMGLALFQMQAGNKPAALGWLEKAVDLRQGFDPSAGPRFAPLAELPGYAKLIDRIRRDNPPVHRARLAFTNPSAGMVTEGLAADPETGSLYIGSLNRHAILRIRPDGAWEDFIRPDQDGLAEPLGLTVDSATRSLWACSNSNSSRAVFQFDLRTARLIHVWKLPGTPDGHFLNDLAVSPQGEAWVTDSRAGKLYHAAKGAAELAEVPAGREFDGANGIAFAPGGKRLYISCFPDGIVVFDPATRTARPIRRPANVTLAMIDGLYCRNGKLFTVQNFWVVYRAVAWTLNAEGDAIEKEQILERAGPDLKDPTTGALLNNTFYFIGNSELEHWKEGKLVDAGAMRAVKIFAVDTAKL
jgi:streptogramin lyase